MSTCGPSGKGEGEKDFKKININPEVATVLILKGKYHNHQLPNTGWLIMS